MNKAIQEFFENKGFTFKSETSFGKLGNYNVTLVYAALDNISPVRLHFTCKLNDEQRNKLNELFNDMKGKFVRNSYDELGVWLLLNDWTANKLVENLDELISSFLNILDEVAAKGIGYCPICGEEYGEKEIATYTEGIFFTAHTECIENMKLIDEAERRAYEAMPDHYFKGLLGALIGAVCAFGSAIIFSLLGIISAISGIIGMFLGKKLYIKFGGKPSIKMILTLIVLVVGTMVLFTICYYGFMLQDSFVSEGYTIGLFEAFKVGMTYPDFKAAFIKSLSITIILTLLGVIPSAIDFIKALQYNHKIQ